MNVRLQAEPEPLEIDPQRTTVMVIDMQNSGARGGLNELLYGDVTAGQKAIDPINRIAGASRESGRKVIYVAHVLSPDLREIGGPDSVLWVKSFLVRMYREHPEWRDKMCLRGTWGAQIREEIKPQEGDIIVEKSRNSAFWGTNLDAILRTLDTRYIVFAGALTNACVESSLRDAYQLGYFSILVPDACVASSPLNEEATIFNVSHGFGWVSSSENFEKALKQREEAKVA